MKDFGTGICPECGCEFKKISSVHKYCKREHKEKSREKARPNRIRLGRKRPYNPAAERRRLERDRLKIRARETAKKTFHTPGPCEGCGGVATDRHHDNYNKPLEIRWFCEACHWDWHRTHKAIPPVGTVEQITLGV